MEQIVTINQKKIHVYDKVPVFSESQIQKQTEKQVKFLTTLFPYLKEDEWHEAGVEIRPLKRDADLKSLKSYNCWRLGEKDEKELYEFLRDGINGRAFCVYYSCYAFDNKLVVSGKQRNKINRDNAVFTCIIPMDFDNIGYEIFAKYKNIFTSLGIETIDIYTGHGVQSIILLDSQVYNKTLLKSWTNLLIQKGFPVDPAFVDCARVLRMPYTFNCKAFDPDDKHYDADNPQAITTTDIGWTERRYKVTDIFERIQSLPDVISMSDSALPKKIDEKPLIPPKSGKQKKTATIEILIAKSYNLDEIKTVYAMLNIDILPEPIIKMLNCTPGGLRNSTLLFLVPFLKNSVGMQAKTIEAVLKIWGNRCAPAFQEDFIHKEVYRLLDYNCKIQYGKYTTEMRKVFGYLEFSQFTRKSKIKLDNTLFDDMSKMKHGAFRIYLALLLDIANNGYRKYTITDISNIVGLKESTIYYNIDGLIKFGYVDKIVKDHKCKRTGDRYEYCVNVLRGKRKGFTLMDKATVVLMLNKLTDTEINLYTCLCAILKNQREQFIGQKMLCEKTGISRNRISELTTQLNDKGFIKKETQKRQNVMFCTYTLNY